MTAEEEAKQLDSVTDNHQESELDSSKASEALGSLGKASASGATGAPPDSAAAKAVKPDDVALIVAELEVTSDEAAQALREAAAASGDGDLVPSALRKLVTS
mmetsp:Transcript_9990/g.23365  ORF Transcript_9990/g.23365 Transcript_9990/m.23365 type:complete len:102 (+) Transcript_9990:117-422(+)